MYFYPANPVPVTAPGQMSPSQPQPAAMAASNPPSPSGYFYASAQPPQPQPLAIEAHPNSHTSAQLPFYSSPLSYPQQQQQQQQVQQGYVMAPVPTLYAPSHPVQQLLLPPPPPPPHSAPPPPPPAPSSDGGKAGGKASTTSATNFAPGIMYQGRVKRYNPQHGFGFLTATHELIPIGAGQPLAPGENPSTKSEDTQDKRKQETESHGMPPTRDCGDVVRIDGNYYERRPSDAGDIFVHHHKLLVPTVFDEEMATAVPGQEEEGRGSPRRKSNNQAKGRGLLPPPPPRALPKALTPPSAATKENLQTFFRLFTPGTAVRFQCEVSPDKSSKYQAVDVELLPRQGTLLITAEEKEKMLAAAVASAARVQERQQRLHSASGFHGTAPRLPPSYPAAPTALTAYSGGLCFANAAPEASPHPSQPYVSGFPHTTTMGTIASNSSSPAMFTPFHSLPVVIPMVLPAPMAAIPAAAMAMDGEALGPRPQQQQQLLQHKLVAASTIGSAHEVEADSSFHQSSDNSNVFNHTDSSTVYPEEEEEEEEMLLMMGNHSFSLTALDFPFDIDEEEDKDGEDEPPTSMPDRTPVLHYH